MPCLFPSGAMDRGAIPEATTPRPPYSARRVPDPGRTPHWPAPLGSRVCVEGRGQGTYVAYDLSPWLWRAQHTIDFHEGGEQTLVSDSLVARRLCCGSGDDIQPVADTWWVFDEDPGTVQVFTSATAQTISLAPTMSVRQLQLEIQRSFGVCPAQQQLFAVDAGGAPTSPQGSDGAHELLARGATGGSEQMKLLARATRRLLVGCETEPSVTVWCAGLRDGMRLLLEPAGPYDSVAALSVDSLGTVHGAVRQSDSMADIIVVVQEEASRVVEPVQRVFAASIVLGFVVGCIVGAAVGSATSMQPHDGAAVGAAVGGAAGGLSVGAAVGAVYGGRYGALFSAASCAGVGAVFVTVTILFTGNDTWGAGVDMGWGRFFFSFLVFVAMLLLILLGLTAATVLLLKRFGAWSRVAPDFSSVGANIAAGLEGREYQPLAHTCAWGERPSATGVHH